MFSQLLHLKLAGLGSSGQSLATCPGWLQLITDLVSSSTRMIKDLLSTDELALLGTLALAVTLSSTIVAQLAWLVWAICLGMSDYNCVSDSLRVRELEDVTFATAVTLAGVFAWSGTVTRQVVPTAA